MCITELTECVTSVQMWMDGVELKLNPDKTIFIDDKHTRITCVILSQLDLSITGSKNIYVLLLTLKNSVRIIKLRFAMPVTIPS